MIKWLLISAFLVNFLIFYWFSSQSARSIENAFGSEEPSEEIVLLSELKVIPPERSLLSADPVLAAEVEVVAEPSAEVKLEDQDVHEALERDGSQLLQADGHGLKVEVGNKGEFSEVGSVVESRLESGVDPEIKPEINGPRLEPEARLPCVFLGRFDSERDAAGLLEKLEGEVGVIAKLQMVVEGLERYLVYMPPFETRIKAKQQQSILREDGIGSSLYYRGALKNGLSLGFFASKTNAGRRYDSLLAAGYDVELKTMTTKMSRYWLELERHDLERLSQLFWEDLANEFPNVSSKPAECAISREP